MIDAMIDVMVRYPAARALEGQPGWKSGWFGNGAAGYGETPRQMIACLRKAGPREEVLNEVRVRALVAEGAVEERIWDGDGDGFVTRPVVAALTMSITIADLPSLSQPQLIRALARVQATRTLRRAEEAGLAAQEAHLRQALGMPEEEPGPDLAAELEDAEQSLRMSEELRLQGRADLLREEEELAAERTRAEAAERMAEEWQRAADAQEGRAVAAEQALAEALTAERQRREAADGPEGLAIEALGLLGIEARRP